MKGKGKKKDGPGAPKKRVKRGKAGAGNGKKAPSGLKLKYPFDSLEKGQSFVVEGADQMEGKVTRHENVRVLAFEYGKRHGMRFKVSPIEERKCVVTRLK